MPREEKIDERNKKSKSDAYVAAVLDLYLRLPHTPKKHRHDDRFLAQRLWQRREPLHRVEAALLLGSARRLFRLDMNVPLQPIRSLRYFLPLIDELRFAGVDRNYINYLRRKHAEFLKSGTFLRVQQLDSHPQSQDNDGKGQLSFNW